MEKITTGSQIRSWRKLAGLDQKHVAEQLGISQSSLCRIEKENKVLTEELLARLVGLVEKHYKQKPPESPKTEAAPSAPETGIRCLKPRVDRLSIIGETYRYLDYIVVPSQYYAIWAGKETGPVNQAIGRLEEQGRLEKEYDYFKLTHEEALKFIGLTKCAMGNSEISKGLTLLTIRAVNALSHHFNDPISIEKSRQLTQSASSLQELLAQGLTLGDKMGIIAEICTTIQKLDKDKIEQETKLQMVVNAATLSSAKIDKTAAQLEEHQDSSRLSRKQIDALEDIFRLKNKEFEHPSVQGLVQRYLKVVFLGDRAHGNTFKDIAQKDFPEMLQRARDWSPTPAERVTIHKRRVRSGMIAADQTVEQPSIFSQTEPPLDRPEPPDKVPLVKLDPPNRPDAPVIHAPRNPWDYH